MLPHYRVFHCKAVSASICISPRCAVSAQASWSNPTSWWLLSSHIYLPNIHIAASLFPIVLCWCGSGACLCLLVCLLRWSVCLFVAWDWRTDGPLRFLLQRERVLQSAASYSMACTAETATTVDPFHSVYFISTNKYCYIMFYAVFLCNRCSSPH